VWIAVASNHKAQLLIDLGQFARARQTLDYERPPIDHLRARRATVAARIERALGHGGRSLIEMAVSELSPGADPHVRMHVLLDDADNAEPACRHAALRRGPADGARARIRRRRDEGAHPARARAKPHRRYPSAAAAMHDLVPQFEQVQPADMYFAQAGGSREGVRSEGDGDQAMMALARGALWVRRTALPNVPEPFRDSFLQRNPTNRALLAAADRRLTQ
jgi:hypothetical protein